MHECLDILKVKTEGADGLALTVPWDNTKEERFKSRMSMAAALATQQRGPEQPHYMDPFHMTRMLLKDEFRPALPPGVSKAWTVAAYPSAAAFRHDLSITGTERTPRFAALLSHHFLTPSKSDPDHEMLKRAVDLATTDDFRRKRARFYEWQEEIIQEEISDEKAIEELELRLVGYREATRKAFRHVIERYAFTVIPIALTMTGAVLSGAGTAGLPAGALPTGLVIGAANGLVQLARF